MAAESGVQTSLLSITVLSQAGGLNIRQAIHGISNILDKAPAGVKVIYKFKVTGEPRVLAIVNISETKDLENLVESIWNLGSVDVSSSPIIHYHDHARNLGVAEDLVKTPVPKLEKDHLYWIDCDIEYHGKTTEELLAIWKKEAEAVYTFNAAGAANLIPFKGLGQRKIHGFLNQTVPAEFDKLTFELPIVVANGDNIHMRTKAIQHLDDYTKEHPL